MPLEDGLYRVVTERFVAGFVVAGNRIVAAAPILRSRLAFWARHAKKVG